MHHLKWFPFAPDLHIQDGEMKGNEIRLFLMIRIMIPIRLCSLPIHSAGICMLGAIE